MDIKICTDEEEWSKITENSPHSTIFHEWRFLKIIEKNTGSKFYPILGLDGTTVIGAYPLFFKKQGLLNMVFSPPPHCAVPYLGPLIIGYNDLKQSKKESIFLGFQRAVDQFIASELKANYTSITTAPGLNDVRPFKWNGYTVNPFYSYIIDFSEGIDKVWDGLKRKLRQNVKKEKTRGIIIKKGGEDELKVIYNMVNERYKDQDRPLNLKVTYLLDLYKEYKDNMQIIIAYYNDECIGGLIDLYYNGKASSWIGNPKPKQTGINSTDLIQWETINFAYESNCQHYEELGANTERLCKYKSKFNPKLSIYYNAKKYTSFSCLLEKSYIKVVKPIKGKIKKN